LNHFVTIDAVGVPPTPLQLPRLIDDFAHADKWAGAAANPIVCRATYASITRTSDSVICWAADSIVCRAANAVITSATDSGICWAAHTVIAAASHPRVAGSTDTYVSGATYPSVATLTLYFCLRMRCSKHQPERQGDCQQNVTTERHR